SESEDASDGECDLPVCDDFPKSHLVTFSNPLFDINDDCTLSDDESFSEEDIPMENFKFFSNALFDLDEEIISTEIDSLLDEFAGELTLLKSIPPGIDDDNLDPEGEIHLVERLLYDNSSPRPPEELNVENSIESFSPSPIPVEDKLLRNNSLSFPKTESFHFDHYDVPSSPRPPAKPPDDGIFFDFELDTGILTTKVVGDIFEHYVLMPRLLPTQPTLFPVIDTLILFSSENEDKFHLLSHRGFKAFQFFSERPMMIYRGDIPILDVLFLHFYPPLQAQV
ncbi:hypothetical protein Tco_0043938, partial [Tanacetum coccineum]